MPNETKGITVKIDADLHAEIKRYLEQHEGMTMAEFITLAVDDELHLKLQQKGEKIMGNMRTIAFQIPEEMFQRIKDYLHRNNMSQKAFVLGLIETELDREQAERESVAEHLEECVSEETEKFNDEEVDNEAEAVDDTEVSIDEEEPLEDEEGEAESAGFIISM